MIRNIPKGWLYTAIRVLSLVALIFASALAVDYYFNANTFCGAGASCDVVAKSDFGQKYGIFLPTLGLLAYSFFFLTSFFFAKTRLKFLGKSLSTFWVPLAIICCAVGAILFIVVQATEIHAFCYLCMGIDTSAVLMVIPAVLLLLKKDDEGDIATRPLFHPVLWLGLYVLAAGAPLSWGSFQPPARTTTAPEFIQSFYKEGKVNIVEISSFDCPHCQKLHPHLNALIESYGDKINFKRITIPLDARKEACIAYYCSELQNKQEAYANCMFEDPSKDADKLLAHARECSIDEASFKDCLVSEQASKAIDDMLKNIRNIGFEGAPTVWIDSTSIVGYNEAKGIQPYRDAIEKTELSLHATFPVAFAICLFISGVLLIVGMVVTILSRNRANAEENTEKKRESESDKSE